MQDYMFALPIGLFLLLGVMSPGPSFILVAQTAMVKSRRQAIAVAMGMGVGATLFAVIASVGLFVLLEAVPALYLVLKVIGGAYLALLAVKMWRSASEPVPTSECKHSQQQGLLGMFLLGLFTQLSNPKTAIVFGSAFAAFLPSQVPAFSYYLICTLAFVIDSGWYLLVALLLSTDKAQQFYAGAKKYICRIASGFMGLMGVRLMFSSAQ